MTKLFGSQLTPEQLEERRKGLGASDAKKIIDGGEAWIELWKDKTGRSTPKRIMGEWDAALRHTTEALQADWYEHKTGEMVKGRGKAVEYWGWPILRCTLDGMIYIPPDQGGSVQEFGPFEAKHVSSFTPDPINWAIAQYTGQIQHQLIVTGTDNAILSIMVGMKEPELVKFTLDHFWAEAYIARCKEFWSYVETDTPPPGAEPMPVSIPIEAMREVDYSTSNEFGSFAAQWLETKLAAKSFQEAEKELKKLVEPDVRKAHGYGIEITRSKAGALTIKEKK